jgi:glutamate-5-semialdehyde dehydrogenase
LRQLLSLPFPRTPSPELVAQSLAKARRGDGNCHVFVHAAADAAMAKAIVLNSKMRRTGVCGAAETLLVDSAAAPILLAPLVGMLIEAGCEVRGDGATQAADPNILTPSSP